MEETKEIESQSEQRTTPRPRYWMVLVALVALTAFEVIISYVQGGIKVPILVVTSALKALLVILFFMHLKFDSRLFAMLFVLGFVMVFPLLLFMAIATPGR